MPGGVHTNYGPGAPYAGAGIAQGNASATLALEACTFTFAPGAINISTDTTHGPIGVYTPGVYCITGAMNVGGPLNLNGAGTYIFRSTGALTSTAGAIVTLTGGSACDVFWLPSQATTLAANTTFVGNIIDDAGITIGANTTILGQTLSFGGTVSTDTVTINVPVCPVTPLPATINVIKQVTNGFGGVSTPADFSIFVKKNGVDVVGSPAAGRASPGTAYSLTGGLYTVSENINTFYTQSFS